MPLSPREHSERLSDLLWLAAFALLLIGSGIGLRSPWPADEPRFALVARDMVLSGDWLFPRVGGDLYADKPPFFFWLLALGYWITGSIRASFLIPALLAACLTLYLVYDLVSRLSGRRAGLLAGLLLASSLQFVTVMRGAQIDPVLCALTTLSLYALLRHLLAGPAWGWYFAAGFAAGIGVITKGVGFLPLLVLAPYALLRTLKFDELPRIRAGLRWLIAPAALLLAIALWLLPMLGVVASSGDPAHAAYRNSILFHQTVQRYASAWHHQQPWYYFIVQVIPGLWLPGSLLLIWLVPRWRCAWRSRDARVWLPLAWVLVTLIFFSASSGKRGVYLLPALPALVIAAGPYLPELLARRAVQRAGVILAGVLAFAGLAGAGFDLIDHPKLLAESAALGTDPRLALWSFALSALLAWTLTARRWPLLAWPAVLACLMLVWSFILNPRIDAERSGRGFMQQVLHAVPDNRELALAGAKEQFFLYLDRPVVNFGHARWQEKQHEADDAAHWLNSAPGRVILMPESLVTLCFSQSPRRVVGTTSGEQWSLVELPADAACAARGDAGRVIRYSPTLLSRMRTES